MSKRLGQTLVVVVFVAFSLLGCAAGGAPASYDSRPLEPEVPAPPMARQEKLLAAESVAADVSEGMNALPGSADLARKIVYTVSLDLIVKDTGEAFESVQQIAEEMGGFVADSNLWRDQDHQRGSMTVRVPAERLDEAVTMFRALAVEVESQQLDSQDVTEEYVDLEARLENERRTERELQELLESRSERGKTADILEVHRELSLVRSQIEQIQGRLNYLENLSSMATVRIGLTPDALVQPVVVAGWRPQGTARDAIRMLLRALQVLIDAAIVFFLLILPIVLIIAIPIVGLVFLIRALVRRARRRRATEAK
jgi:hypothetical protein